MKDTKIIQLLKGFSENEIKEFRKFVCSPYFNDRKIVIKFYDSLKKYYPDFENVNKEKVFRKVYPGRKFNSRELTRLSSYLFKLGMEYLAVSYFKNFSFDYENTLLMSLDEHYSDSIFEKQYKYATKKLNGEKIHNHFFLYKALMEVTKIDFKLRRNKQKDICLNVIKHAEFEILNAIVKTTFRYVDMLANEHAYNYDFHNTVPELFISNFNFDNFIKNLKTEETRYYNFILYYYYQFKAFSEPSNEYNYKMLREHSSKDFDKLNYLEMTTRYVRLFGYCIKQLQNGNLEFLRELFELHKEALEKKLYGGISGDFIPPAFFRNFVMYGIAAKEYNYIEKFITKYRFRLHDKCKDDLISVSNAMLQFEKKQYTEALNSLSTVKYTYSTCQMDTKTLSIKIFYETADYESLFSLIDTFKHFLKNDKTIRDELKMKNISFLNYVNKLAKTKLSSKNEFLLLEKSVKKEQKIDPIQKIWLMEKIQELSTVRPFTLQELNLANTYK